MNMKLLSMMCIGAFSYVALPVLADRSSSTSASTSTASSVASSSKSSTAASTKHATKTESAAASPAVKTGSDRLELDTTRVTGSKELPKVLYIVPWKKADVGNLPGQPFNTLLDEALAPVDREVFRREVDYYQAISNKDKPGKGYANTPNSAQPATQSQGK